MIPAEGKGRRVKRKPTEITGTVADYVRLFVAVLTLFVLQASLPESAVATLLQVFVGGTALMLALVLADVSKRTQVIVGVLIAAALVASIVQLAVGRTDHGGGALLLINGALVAAGPPAVFMAIRQHPTVSVRTVLGSMTIYVLIGLFFAFLYRAFLSFDDSAFTTGSGALDPAAMQYFSFVTLTTVGFGDITPSSGYSRTVVALEALIGQIYLVTVVALVVGNIGRSRRSQNDGD